MSGTKCGQCGHDNDPTRVFCQNCGTRLDREEAAPTSPTTTPVPVKRTSKRQGPSLVAMLLQFLKGLISLAFLGAVIALFIQLGRHPDGLPEPVQVNDAQAADVFNAVKTFATSTFRRTLDLKQEQVNNYLASRVASASADEGGVTAGAQFGRAFVVCQDGKFQFFVERKYVGLSFYFYVDCEPLAGPEGATAFVKGGGIGRVRLPAQLLGPVQARVIDPVVEALAEPLEILRQANQVAIEPGVVRLGWSGKPVRR